MTPNELLLKASRKGDVDAFNSAMAAGADVNCIDYNGCCPLFHASNNNHASYARLLLDAGSQVDIRDSLGMTPLMMSVLSGYPACLSVLIAAKADIHAKCEKGINSAQRAAQWHRPECMRLLVEAGVDLSASRISNWTLLKIVKTQNWTKVLAAWEAKALRSTLVSRPGCDEGFGI